MSTPTHSTFHIFPRFPKEIRYLIWEHTLPGKRVFPVRRQSCRYHVNPGEILLDGGKTWQEWTQAQGGTCSVGRCRCWVGVNFHDLPLIIVGHVHPNPITLRINREARKTAHLSYKIAFGTTNLYFSFERDSLLFIQPEQKKMTLENHNEGPMITFPDIAVHKDLMKVQNIIISAEIAEALYNWGVPQVLECYSRGGVLLRQHLRYFKGLKVVSLCSTWEPWQPWPNPARYLTFDPVDPEVQAVAEDPSGVHHFQVLVRRPFVAPVAGWHILFESRALRDGMQRMRANFMRGELLRHEVVPKVLIVKHHEDDKEGATTG